MSSAVATYRPKPAVFCYSMRMIPQGAKQKLGFEGEPGLNLSDLQKLFADADPDTPFLKILIPEVIVDFYASIDEKDGEETNIRRTFMGKVQTVAESGNELIADLLWHSLTYNSQTMDDSLEMAERTRKIGTYMRARRLLKPAISKRLLRKAGFRSREREESSRPSLEDILS